MKLVQQEITPLAMRAPSRLHTVRTTAFGVRGVVCMLRRALTTVRSAGGSTVRWASTGTGAWACASAVTQHTRSHHTEHTFSTFCTHPHTHTHSTLSTHSIFCTHSTLDTHSTCNTQHYYSTRSMQHTAYSTIGAQYHCVDRGAGSHRARPTNSPCMSLRTSSPRASSCGSSCRARR